MTNAIATLDSINDLSFNELAALTGQGSNDSGPYIPVLKINRDPDDEDGNTLPTGQYSIVTPEHGRIFSTIDKNKGAITFQPLFQSFRYGIWDNDAGKYTRQSIIFPNFQADAPDDGGGNKCGKMSKKQLENASEATKEAQKKIKCSRMIWGLVNGDFVKIDGTKVTLENFLVLWQTGGASFMAVQPALDQLLKAKRPMMYHYLTLTKPRREKNGATIYYVPEITLDMTVMATFGQQHLDTLKAVLDLVKNENAAIMEKHKAAVAKGSSPSDAQDAALASKVVGGSLADDLNDEIPY